jgi:uncharacterized protein YbaA (DUF1428 family)
MGYVDGFVAAVPTANKDAFTRHATMMSGIFMEFGAVRVIDCWQDDVPRGTNTDFFMAVKATAEEEVVFSWVEWPSKDARDDGWARMMADPRMQDSAEPLPFDGKRLIYGGFSML